MFLRYDDQMASINIIEANMDSNSKVRTGICTHYNADRTFGFLRETNENGDFCDHFFHISKLKSGAPSVGAVATFTLGTITRLGTEAPAVCVCFEPNAVSGAATGGMAMLIGGIQ